MNSKALHFKKNKVRLILWNIWLRLSKIKLHGATIGWGSWIKSELTVGYGSATGWGFVVRGAGNAHIGRYCAIGENVRLITSNHDLSSPIFSYLIQDIVFGKRSISTVLDVKIGNDVWVGDNVIILPGVNIGDGAVISAGAVVSRDVDSFSIVAGVPAIPIGSRFEGLKLQKILQSKWWEKSVDEIKNLNLDKIDD